MPTERTYDVSSELKTTIPSLQILAANAVFKANPNQFFQFHNKEIAPAIKERYVDKVLNQAIDEQVSIYQAKVEQRQDKIDDRTDHLSSSECFEKVSACTFTSIFSGLHVGTYFILKAANVDPSTQLTFICTIPVTIFVSMCIGMCLTKPAARALAHCFTSGVSDKLTVDLDELGRTSQLRG